MYDTAKIEASRSAVANSKAQNDNKGTSNAVQRRLAALAKMKAASKGSK